MISLKIGAAKAHLQKGVDTLWEWGKFLGRNLNSSSRLPEFFRSRGLETVQQDVMPVIGFDGEKDLRLEYSRTVPILLLGLFVQYAQIEQSPLTIEEAVKIGQMMKREAELGEAYIRNDFNIVVGRKLV